jgi:hypothetical protein
MIRYQIAKTKRGYMYGDWFKPTIFYRYFTIRAKNLHEARKIAKKEI